MSTKLSFVRPFPFSFSFEQGSSSNKQIIDLESSSYPVNCSTVNNSNENRNVPPTSKDNCTQTMKFTTKKLATDGIKKKYKNDSANRKDLSICIQFISEENENLRKTRTELSKSIFEKRREVEYLRGLLKNSSSIRKILRNAGVKQIHSDNDDDVEILDETNNSRANFELGDDESVSKTNLRESKDLEIVFERDDAQSVSNLNSMKNESGICFHMKGNGVILLPPCRECGAMSKDNSDDWSDPIRVDIL